MDWDPVYACSHPFRARKNPAVLGLTESSISDDRIVSCSPRSTEMNCERLEVTWVKEDCDQCEGKDQGSRGTATDGVLWLHEWVFILLCSAVCLTCAICLGLGDGRLQRLLRRDCSLSHGRTGICVKATKPAVWKTSAACSTTVTLAHTHTAHIFIQQHWYTGLSFTPSLLITPFTVHRKHAFLFYCRCWKTSIQSQ